MKWLWEKIFGNGSSRGNGFVISVVGDGQIDIKAFWDGKTPHGVFARDISVLVRALELGMLSANMVNAVKDIDRGRGEAVEATLAAVRAARMITPDNLPAVKPTQVFNRGQNS